MKDCKECIIQAMAAHGWHKDRLVDALTKYYRTNADPSKQASFWIQHSKELEAFRIGFGDFTSAGENVLSTASLIVPEYLEVPEIKALVDDFLEDIERRIASAYCMKVPGRLAARP